MRCSFGNNSNFFSFEWDENGENQHSHPSVLHTRNVGKATTMRTHIFNGEKMWNWNGLNSSRGARGDKENKMFLFIEIRNHYRQQAIK